MTAPGPETVPGSDHPTGHPPQPVVRRRPGRPPLAGNEQTKSRILGVALRAFAEQGYEGVSMRAVAELAEVTPATVSYHFPTKDDLYLAAFVSAVDSVYASYSAAIDGCTSFTEELAALCDCNIRILADDPAPLHLAIRAHIDLDRPRTRWPHVPDSARQVLDGIIERAIRRGEVEPGGRTRLERTLQLLLWGSSMIGLNRDVDRDECNDAIRAMLTIGR
jgi:AcrR family transcriptional regulator